MIHKIPLSPPFSKGEFNSIKTIKGFIPFFDKEGRGEIF